MRILGLDMGERRIGVAICDPEERLAVPLKTLSSRGQAADIRAIAELAEQEQAGALVLGLPLSLHGEAGPQAQRVRDFGRALAEAVSQPVEYWDERFSSAEAERLLSQVPAAVSSGRRRRSRILAGRDALAATIILQSFLDRRRQKRASPGGE
jgi:putative Holliday junction resolvase